MLECPYCGEENHVDPADDEFYEQNTLHQYQCGNCEKNFIFETEVSVTFYPRRAYCLNDSQHNWKKTYADPKTRTKMRCTECGELRPPTKEELAVILKS